MNYIKPETTNIAIELSNVVMGSEKGLVSPGTEKGTKEKGRDDIVMSKGGWPFGEEVENEWPESKSLWDE